MVEKILELNREKTIFWSLIGILFFCACIYIYFINLTVHNVVARQTLEAEASQLSLNIGKQEFQYISKRNSVTLEKALALGFKEVVDKKFISRIPDTRIAFLSH
jgi:hypothetical protein